MRRIKFKKDGLYLGEYDEDRDSMTWSRSQSPIYAHFQDVVEIDKRTTLGDIITTLMKHEMDINSMFVGCMNGRQLKPYYEEMIQPTSQKRTDISHIEIGWIADYYKGDKQHEDELYLGIQASGIAKESDEMTYYSLSKATLNEWRHLRVILVDSMMINDFIIGENTASGVTDMHMVTLFQARKEITLYDFICGLLTELTTLGYPEQRIERIQDINNILDNDIEVNTLMLENKERELREAVDSENYEKAGILQKEVNRMRKILDKD